MKTIQEKIKDAKSFLETHKRNYNNDNILCINIKYTRFIDMKDIKNLLNKTYYMDLLNEINFEKEFDFYMEMENDFFFDFAKNLLKGYKVYQYGRSGGWLGIPKTYNNMIDTLENMEYDLCINTENKYYESKKEMHEDGIFNEIESIKEAFKQIKEYHKNFFDNLNENFIDYIENNVIETMQEDIKQQQEKYNKLAILINS